MPINFDSVKNLINNAKLATESDKYSEACKHFKSAAEDLSAYVSQNQNPYFRHMLESNPEYIQCTRNLAQYFPYSFLLAIRDGTAGKCYDDTLHLILKLLSPTGRLNFMFSVFFPLSGEAGRTLNENARKYGIELGNEIIQVQQYSEQEEVMIGYVRIHLGGLLGGETEEGWKHMENGKTQLEKLYKTASTIKTRLMAESYLVDTANAYGNLYYNLGFYSKAIDSYQYYLNHGSQNISRQIGRAHV